MSEETQSKTTEVGMAREAMLKAPPGAVVAIMVKEEPRESHEDDAQNLRMLRERALNSANALDDATLVVSKLRPFGMEEKYLATNKSGIMALPYNVELENLIKTAVENAKTQDGLIKINVKPDELAKFTMGAEPAAVEALNAALSESTKALKQMI